MAFSAQKLRDSVFTSHFVTIAPSTSPKNIVTANSLDKENLKCPHDLKTKSKLLSTKLHKKGYSKLNSTKIKVKLKGKSVSEKSSIDTDLGVSQKSVENNINSSHKHTVKNTIRKGKKRVSEQNMSEDHLVSDVSKNSMNLEEVLLSGIEVEKLVKGLQKENDVNDRCQNALILALDCLSKDFFGEFQESGCLNTIFELLSDSHDSNNLVLCYSLLLCSVSKNSLTIAEIKVVEESILLMLKYMTVPKYENGTYKSVEANCMQMLTETLQGMAHKLCRKLFSSDVDPKDINISTLSCISLRNLSAHAKEYYQIGISYSFNSETLNYVFGMTGKTTQEVISENPASLKESNASFCIATHTVNHCLQVLEH